MGQIRVFLHLELEIDFLALAIGAVGLACVGLDAGASDLPLKLHKTTSFASESLI